MDSTYRAIVVALASLLVCSECNAQRALDLRLKALPSAAAVRKIAELGKPTNVSVGRRDTVDSLIKARCGYVASDYVEAAVKENRVHSVSELESQADATGSLALPACARYDQRAQVPTPTDSHSENAEKTIRLEQLSTIGIRVGTDADVAAKAIDQTLRARHGTAAAVQTATLVEAVDFPTDECAPPADKWPIDHAGLMQALADDARDRANDQLPTTDVLVLDTGFPTSTAWDRAVPPSRMGKMLGVNEQSGISRYSGVNLATSLPDATPPASLSDWSHGAQVASVLLGSAYLDDDQPEAAALPIRLSFASAALTDGDSSFLAASAIAALFSQAKHNQIPIVNVSLLATDDDTSFSQAIRLSGGDVLLVVAAGNSDTQIRNGVPMWPASYGASSSGHGGYVVTVGSHDGKGRIASFSNRGYQSVDLLAPGCAIPAYDISPGGEGAVAKVVRNGTSFSAPIVSLVAALLRSEGLSIPDIKARLIVGTDVDGALDSLVYSRGILNVRKALTVYRDVISYDLNGAIVTKSGELLNRNAIMKACGFESSWKNVMKFSTARDSSQPDQPPAAYVWSRPVQSHDPSNLGRQSGCPSSAVTGEPLHFRGVDEGTDTFVGIADLVDFVSRSVEP